MCLYPKLILNRKYRPNKKNNYRPPILKDGRLKYVSVGCGNCIECRQQKANEWRTRLANEIKGHKFNYFVTLTFCEETLDQIEREINKSECNAVAGVAIRRFLERYRKKYKHSLKHWLITELGHTNTERIHLHGLIMLDNPMSRNELQGLWKYGIADNGKFVNEQTINYITKYVTKIDMDHKGYKAQIFSSPGIGRIYVDDTTKGYHEYRPGHTRDYYTLSNGVKVSLPIYYRNKIFSEEERERLWIEKIEDACIYVRGIKIENIDTKEGQQRYFDILQTQQQRNRELGFGDDSGEWKKQVYNTRLKDLNTKSR